MHRSDEEPKAPTFDLRPKERFSTRVDAYARYRPSYPRALVVSLMQKFPTTPPESLSVADIGSGTGIFSRLLLESGFTVFGVEPNVPMRQRAEAALSSFRGFYTIHGEATQTFLPDRSMDVVAAAQSFHWFATPNAVKEFLRILNDRGLVVLIWNDRRTGIDEFHRDYESILQRYCHEYSTVNHRNVTLQMICDLFRGWKISVEHFESNQRVDFEKLKGRLESSSYCPAADDPNYAPLMDELRGLFDKHARNEEIILRQDCVAYFSVPVR